MKQEKKHGGARKGSGRKKGTGQGRKVISKTIAMRSESWTLLDEMRGDISRGKYIEEKIGAL